MIAYGQTGTGKTHTMMGIHGGVDGLLTLTQPNTEGEPPKVDSEAQGMILKTAHRVFQLIQESPPWTEYMIRCSYVEIYLEKILDLLNPGGDGKLSIVEDFAGDEAAGAGDAAGGVRIAGAAELCCFDEADVYKLLARGNAYRTMSSTEMNTDSSRSHAIFIMKVEQHDKKTDMATKSELQMVDLAGSEMASNQSASASKRDGSSVQMEAKMINKSLTALQNCIRAQLENQKGAKHAVAAMSKRSKLTRFLRPSFGGNCMTFLILTASPSSYNIGETISTIRFGQRVKRIHNPAVVNDDYSREVYQKRLKESENRRKAQLAILKAVALECKKLKAESLQGTIKEDEHGGPLWDTIEELLASEDADGLDFNTFVQQRRNLPDDGTMASAQTADDELEKALREIQNLREQLESVSQARDDSENQLSELESEVAVLRSQNEHLIADKTKDLEELINAKNELQIMSQRKIEVEHNFRTSQFRENEAIVFLRQFRRFYKNVLRDRAAHGSGNLKDITTEISEKVPGALDLSQLVDADTLMFEAGLIEEHEMRDEKPAPVYVPSKAALIRSATNAKKAAKELEAIEKESAGVSNEARAAMKREDSTQSTNTEGPGLMRASFVRRGSAIRRSSFTSLELPIAEEETEMTGDTQESGEEPNVEHSVKPYGAGADAGAGSSQPAGQAGGTSAKSGLLWDQSGVAVTKRQQLLGTPSGRFSIMQEKNMERELADMADKCVKLEQALKEERATVDMLSGRAGGLNKKKLAQEAIQLRQLIEKKTNNLMAIAWKMNELNLINKSYNEKMVNREQHVIYLEENYEELQNRNRVIIEQQQEAERKLRDELVSVKKVLDGMSVPLWQYKEEKPTEGRFIASRIHIPVLGGSQLAQIDEESPKRRLSDAETEPSLDWEVPAIEKVDSSTQTDEVELEDAGVQTDSVEKREVGTEESLGTAIPLSQPIESVTSHQIDDGELTDTVGKLAAVGAIEATSSEESESEDEFEETTMERLIPTGALGASAGAATTASIFTQINDFQRKSSESENDTDLPARGLAAVGAAESAEEAVPREIEDAGSEGSDSDDETDETTGECATGTDAISRGMVDESEMPVSDDENEEIIGKVTVKAAVSGETDERQSIDAESNDDIEAITRELATTGVVPQTVAVDSHQAVDDESLDGDVVDKPPWVAGRAAPIGISDAAVLAAAASIKREAEKQKSKELKPADQKSKDDNDATFKAKNLFAATVFSVLNRGSTDKKEETETIENPAADNEDVIESYHGDGHSLKHSDQKTENQSSSRDEWAAARDDFDSIFEETAQAVNTSSLRRKPTIEDRDPEKFAREFKAIAAKIGHQSEEQIVTMGSKRQLEIYEEATRKPWEKGTTEINRRPWEKASKKSKDDGFLGESFDFAKDAWYRGSDDESEGSYQFENHVFNRPQKEESRRGARVKFSDSTIKRDTSSSEDEFDQTMNATQAALGAAEDIAEEEVEGDGLANDTVSLTSKEEALFTGGRTHGHPRRSVDRPKIRAGVLKEEKKPSRDKRRSELLKKKPDSSRRKVGDEKKRKKKEEKKSGKSTRDLARAKSERHPHKRDKEESHSPKRTSTR